MLEYSGQLHLGRYNYVGLVGKKNCVKKFAVQGISSLAHDRKTAYVVVTLGIEAGQAFSALAARAIELHSNQTRPQFSSN